MESGKSIKTDWAVSKPHACISNTRDSGKKSTRNSPCIIQKWDRKWQKGGRSRRIEYTNKRQEKKIFKGKDHRGTKM